MEIQLTFKETPTTLNNSGSIERTRPMAEATLSIKKGIRAVEVEGISGNHGCILHGSIRIEELFPKQPLLGEDLYSYESVDLLGFSFETKA